MSNEETILDEQELLYSKEYNKKHINIAIVAGFIMGFFFLALIIRIALDVYFIFHPAGTITLSHR